MSKIADGIYSIALPYGGGVITDTGEGRFLNLLQPGTLGPNADQIKVTTDSKGSTFQFAESQNYVGYEGGILFNNKFRPLSKDKAAYFKIEAHPYDDSSYTISMAAERTFGVGAALERIYPPWVAMLSFPEKQAWNFNKVSKANL